MSEDRKYDDDTQKFYDENKDMIEKILAAEKTSRLKENAEYLEELAKRKAFETKMRAAFEAEKARRMAFVRADQLHSDMIDARVCTEEAYEEARDHIVDYSRKQADYIYDLMEEEFDRMRSTARRGRDKLKSAYEEDGAELKDTAERVKSKVNGGLETLFRPLVDEQFQKHLVGAGLELWMAMNALLKASPLPDSIKNAMTVAETSKNREFCAKNQDCPKKPAAGGTTETPRNQIKITPLKKEEEQ